MGTSVINPMIFYWINVLENLQFMVVFMLLTLSICLLARFFWYNLGLDNIQYGTSYSYDKDKREAYIEKGNKQIALSKKWLTPNIIVVLVCVVICVLIPSRDTMLTMLVADMITYENIELTKDSAMALVDYIVEQVKAITG